ncbi:glycosyltransferase [Caballeronia grimmiae]|uniref:glycosyltransferase n=1 Tax=Caballeronia grimmiae TaxID=1071679 RepID=UPI0038B73749
MSAVHRHAREYYDSPDANRKNEKHHQALKMHPKVSVIMATYNHGPYVAEAIHSVLSQDFTDFEFIIADDGSTDDTREVVASIEDARISFYPNVVNRGACIVTNELIGHCTGEYIALLNSDDRWLPGKLRRQVRLLDERAEVGAVFGRARFIDRDGVPIPASNLHFGTVFDQENRTRGEWLRRFFYLGNCLCHPTIMVRRSVYAHLGKFNNRYRQLPDLDMWIRLVKHYDLHVMDSCEIDFRIMPGENASSQTRANAVRTMNEHYLIAEHFFEEVSADLLREGFHDQLWVKHVPSDVHLEIEKALLYRNEAPALRHAYALVGMSRLNALLSDETAASTLLNEYRIGDGVFQDWSSKIDTLRPVWPDDEPPPQPLSLKPVEEVLLAPPPDPDLVSMTPTIALATEIIRRMRGKYLGS